MQNLLDDLKGVLAQDERFVVDGKLLKNKIIEAGLQLDPGLIKLLLQSEQIKAHFFQEVDGVLVFDKVKLQQFVSNKEFLPDSYTAFKNKIGLTADGEFLAENKDVVLSWAYKDCVLEGGQDKEDTKRDEVFWNEVLAPGDIDRLLHPKVLTNWKRYNQEGEEEAKEVSLDDNLILKGNNLLALHSLKKVYRGRVKLIYIDPPYNTESDGFQYNDNFNHSTWLTFMKNRLEVARLLLKEEGVIFVHCDNNEQAYLKVLLDEIFGRECFIESITVVNNPRGRDYGGVANMHEYIHVYAKNPNAYEMYRLYDPEKEFPFQDERGGFEIRELRNRNTAFNDQNRKNLFYPFYLNPNARDENGFFELSLEEKQGWVKVLPAKSQGIQTVWRWGKEKAIDNLNKEVVGKEMNKGGYMIVEKYRDKTRLARSVWWDKEVNSEKGTVHLRELFGAKVFNYPKPEGLIQRIIEISTQEGDRVLDYHLGSGTTAAVAQKMKRKYIGIEQMSYIEDVAVERMKKVIDGEGGGISKAVNWQGGGSFVYAELKRANQAWIDEVMAAESDKALNGLWEKMQKHAFISYKVEPKAISETTKDFESLDIEDKKRFLVEVLDKNALYVNFTDIENQDFQVSEKDKALTKLFYSLK